MPTPGFAEANSTLLQGWKELAAAPPPDLDPWLCRHLERLGRQEIDVAAVVRGEGCSIPTFALTTSSSRPTGASSSWTGPGPATAPLGWTWCCSPRVNAEGGADAELLVRSHSLTGDISAPGSTPSY
jgi:hypothetical protein